MSERVSQNRILHDYQMGKYVPDHPWDQYVMSCLQVESLDELDIQRRRRIDPEPVRETREFILKTATDEWVVLGRTRANAQDWGTLNLTSNCPGCSFFVPKNSDLVAAVEQLRKQKDPPIEIPERVGGFCTYRQTAQLSIIPGLLRYVPTEKLRNCVLGAEKRAARYKLRHAMTLTPKQVSEYPQ